MKLKVLPYLPLFFALLIFISAMPLFFSTAEFTGDDFYFVVNNPVVTTPGLSSFANIWLKPMKIEYFPATITSFALEYRIWGDSVRLYHLTNILIFAGIGFAAYKLARQLLARFYPEEPDHGRLAIASLAATILMLCHPLNVESVASISNRKELLYVLFGLLSLNFCVLPDRKAKGFAGALIFLLLAQFSKGTAVILPGLFWVCELFVLKSQERKKRFILPVIASVISIIIFKFQFSVAYRAGVVEKSTDIDLITRVGGVIRSLNIMLSKFLLPINLSYDYDFAWPKTFPPLSEWLLPSAFILIIIFMTIKKKYGFVSVSLMILLTLFPYSNIIPLHHNSEGQIVFYDHYLLFAIMLTTTLVAMLLMHLREKAFVWATVSALTLSILFTGYNYYLFGFWKDRESLYSRIIQVTPNLPKGYLFLGKLLNEKGRHVEAATVLARLFTLDNWFPVYIEAYKDIGNAYAFSGQLQEAENSYRLHLKYQPKDRATLQNLSAALLEQGKYYEAKVVILSWLLNYPGDSDAIHNLQLCR
ncbi:MAG: hypothetical protein HXX17_06530 [Geobacteraceae bacterium]|nr:hypothetical protein [Geobacteraceae bacterium]